MEIGIVLYAALFILLFMIPSQLPKSPREVFYFAILFIFAAFSYPIVVGFGSDVREAMQKQQFPPIDISLTMFLVLIFVAIGLFAWGFRLHRKLKQKERLATDRVRQEVPTGTNLTVGPSAFTTFGVQTGGTITVPQTGLVAWFAVVDKSGKVIGPKFIPDLGSKSDQQ